MNYPKLKELKTSRTMVDAFRGYNHNLRLSDGEFFDMKNMTSDYYPIAAPRGKRSVFADLMYPQGLIAKDSLCYVEGPDFIIGEYRIPMDLSTAEEDCPKQLTSMGAYVIIMPDKKYINTMDLNDYGSIEASFRAGTDVTFTLCTITGDTYDNPTISATAPSNPENLDCWIDTSSVPHTLKRYTTASEMWVSIATTYVKITSPGLGKAFKQYDGVTISGITNDAATSLNGSAALWGCGEDYIVIVGMIDAVATQNASEGTITITRQMPNMDFIIESENRLWGCRYGTAVNGDVVNEIYASKLGDFRNWNCFMNLATDSYTASCGTDGPFTGAITHLGYPLFFKENCVHKVYGNYPANFQIQTTVCRGVQKGSHNSLAIVNETLFYKGITGVCAYDGSLPVEASSALGSENYSDAVAGAHGNKYYISMKDEMGAWHLFVYDVAKGMWHKEDDLHADDFCSCRGELYCIDHDSKSILTMAGPGAGKEEVEWMVETGEIGISSPDMKYISRLIVRMSLEVGSEIRFSARYDFSNDWEELFTMRGTSLRSFSIPIRPKRCDHMKIRIEGQGGAKIYSITKIIEQGSDIS